MLPVQHFIAARERYRRATCIPLRPYMLVCRRVLPMFCAIVHHRGLRSLRRLRLVALFFISGAAGAPCCVLTAAGVTVRQDTFCCVALPPVDAYLPSVAGRVHDFTSRCRPSRVTGRRLRRRHHWVLLLRVRGSLWARSAVAGCHFTSGAAGHGADKQQLHYCFARVSALFHAFGWCALMGPLIPRMPAASLHL